MGVRRKIRKLIKLKYNKKLTWIRIERIYNTIKNESNDTKDKYTNFIQNIISLDNSNDSIHKKLKKYFKYILTEHEIEKIDSIISKKEKLEFLANNYSTNQRALILYKKDFKTYFKYQIYNTGYSKLKQIFIDYINYGTTYCTENLRLLDLENIKIYEPHEQRLIKENNQFFEYDDSFELPEDFSRFIGLELNYVQKIVSKSALLTNENFLVCAPTGIGKTIIGVMAIYKLLQDTKFVRIAYIAPMKSLSFEIYGFLKKLFTFLNIFECTSDTQISKLDIINFNILVGTPEKIEILMRNNPLLRFNLIILDEIHVLNENRGHVIESLVMRSKIHKNCRLVGMSATIYNYEDVGSFLKCKSHNIYYFNESYRPVPIKYKIIQSQNFKVDLLDILNEMIGPYLIFVHSRKDTIELSDFLCNYLNIKKDKCDESCIICQTDTEIYEKYFNYGIGIHHAGLSKEIKLKMEHLFRIGRLNILISTSTLSYGINLPIKTVIIMGSRFFNKNKNDYEILSNMSIKQMLGRAGRDSSINDLCNGIVLSETFIDSYFYEQTIESNLLINIHNTILSQIQYLKSIHQISDWFKESYFYIRLRKINPEYFKYSLEIIYTTLNNLIMHKMINHKYEITHLGKICNKFYIDYKDCWYVYNNLHNIMLDGSFLDILSGFNIFKDIKIKNFVYQDFNQNFLIPCKSEVSKLYQLFISGIILQADILEDNLSRIFKCILEISLYRKYYVSKLAIEYYKSSVTRLFIYENPIKQISGKYTGPSISTKILIKICKDPEIKFIPNFILNTDFFDKYMRLSIFTQYDYSKFKKFMILIFNDDKLLIKDILYINNREFTKFYKIKKFKYYEINIISYDLINCTYRKTVERNDIYLQFKLFKPKNVIRSKFLEYYDRINDTVYKIREKSLVLVSNPNLLDYYGNAQQINNLMYNQIFNNEPNNEFNNELNNEFNNEPNNEFNNELNNELNNEPNNELVNEFNDELNNDIHIIGEINPSEYKKIRKLDISNRRIFYHCDNLQIKIKKSNEFILSSSSLTLLDKNIKNNMNMGGLIKLIFSLPEMYKKIIDENLKKYNGSEYGMNYLIFNRYLYEDMDYDTTIVKYCINILFDKCSNKKYLKTMFNILFLLQRINKYKDKKYELYKNEDKLIINMIDKYEDDDVNIYILNKDSEYKVYKLDFLGKKEVLYFEGVNYILCDHCKGYEIF